MQYSTMTAVTVIKTNYSMIDTAEAAIGVDTEACLASRLIEFLLQNGEEHITSNSMLDIGQQQITHPTQGLTAPCRRRKCH